MCVYILLLYIIYIIYIYIYIYIDIRNQRPASVSERRGAALRARRGHEVDDGLQRVVEAMMCVLRKRGCSWSVSSRTGPCFQVTDKTRPNRASRGALSYHHLGCDHLHASLLNQPSRAAPLARS